MAKSGAGTIGAPNNGKPIRIAATSSPGTLLYTATPTTTNFDVVTVVQSNTDTTDHKVVYEWGGVTSAEQIWRNAPAQETTVGVDGHFLNNGLEVRAYCPDGSHVNAYVDFMRYRTSG